MKNPFVPDRVIAKRRSLVELYFDFIDSKRASDRLFFYIFLIVAFVSGSLLLIEYSHSKTIITPTVGGELREGIIGSPRFVNPVLAITRADQDMVALVFDGLMTINEEGELVPELADSLTVSSDATVYNVVLRQDITFHDGTPLTADDVLFTIDLIKDPNLKSPLQGNFDGVLVEKLGDYELNFVLEEPYAPFIENLTVGILPKHLWEKLSIDQIPFSQHNTEPIGTGPYQIETLARNTAGLINGYTLGAYTSTLHEPKIETVSISFFSSEEQLIEALSLKKVDSATGIESDIDDILELRPGLTESETALPRTFGLFFNQNKSAALRQSAVRQALSAAVDREELIEVALHGHGLPINSPIPAGFYPQHDTQSTSSLRAAADILESNGWDKNTEGIWTKEIDSIETELSIDIATANLPFLSETAAYLEKTWSELGVRVSVRQFEQSDLTQAIIRSRDYEALLFGVAVGRNLDLYPFWHSSQRNDPGLNVSLYANITADAALEDARQSTSTEERDASLELFLTEFESDVPAIFLFVPTIGRVTPNTLVYTPIKKQTAPYERFANIDDWYIETQSVWPIFSTEQ